MTEPATPIRHPPLPLEQVRRRIRERREAARYASNETTRAVIDADTDMLEDLAGDVRNLRLANAALKDVVRALQGRLTAVYERYFR